MTPSIFLKKIIPPKYHSLIAKLANIISGIFIDSFSWSQQEKIKVPQLLFRTARYRLAGIGLPLTKNDKALLSFHNKHLTERAFILGNGPSLNKCDLTLLKNEITFGVNNIFMNFDKMCFHPTYYVVEDTLVAEDRAELINNYQGPQYKFFGNYLKYCIQGTPNSLWINVKVDYREYPDFPNFSTNAARMVWVGGTVSYICLQLAYYMGIKKVYMIGFDHNYQIPLSAVVGESGQITSQADDPNHFHPGYFGKGYRWNDPRVPRMEKAFVKAKIIYEKNNRKIYNATVGGRLEVFDRVQYDDLF
jgi:hypothetical protein